MPPPNLLRASLQALPDMELVRLACAGDRPAFAELARRHVGVVRGSLRRMGAPADLADDLAQEAFLGAFERLDDFRGQGAFPGWVKRIAARLYLKRWRRRERLPEPAGEADYVGRADAGAERAPASPLDLDAALASLPACERLCVALALGVGLTHAEISEATGAPLSTVKAHVALGVARLSPLLGGAGQVSTGEAGHG